MDKRDLVEFLSGRRTLTESFSTPGANLDAGGIWNGRQERLAQAWRDLIVKMEALFLDVLDASEIVYSECLPLLKDVRGSRGENCWDNLARFEELVGIVSRQEGEPWGSLLLHLQELKQDLEWMCDQLAPRDDMVPEKPPKDKESWMSAKDAQAMNVPPPSMGFKPANESKAPALPPICPSLVMASLSRAADNLAEASRVASNFHSAGDAIRLTIETYTDVDRAVVEVLTSVPGNAPKLRLTCEWNNSEKVGTADFHWDRGLVIEGSDSKIVEAAERVTDADIAEAFYSCLRIATDLSPRRVWEAARIVPTLYRLIERCHTGAYVPAYEFDAVVDSFRTHLGLHESVLLTPDQMNLRRVEENGAVQHCYYWDWEQRYQEPFPYKDGELTQGEYEDREIRAAIFSNEDYDKYLGEGVYSDKWTSPRLVIDVQERKVMLVSSDGEEDVLAPETTDEDATARLLSLSQQKESHSFLSEWECTFRGELQEGNPHLTSKLTDLGEEEDDDEAMTEQGFEPKDHPRDAETGEFVDTGSATGAQKKAAYRASKKVEKDPVSYDDSELGKKAKKARELHAQRKELLKQKGKKSKEYAPIAPKDQPEYEPKAQNKLPPVDNNQEEPTDTTAPEPQAEAPPPGPSVEPQAAPAPEAPPEEYGPRKGEKPSRIPKDPEKSTVSRYNPDLDAAFGMETPDQPKTEPFRSKVPEPPGPPVDVSGQPKETPQRPSPSDEPPLSPSAAPAAPAAPALPPGFEDLADDTPMGPGVEPKYRRPPEELSAMDEQTWDAIRQNIYARTAGDLGNDPAMDEVRKQSERDVDDLLRSAREESAKSGTEFAQLSPEQKEQAVREQMRARLEKEVDRMWQETQEWPEELKAKREEWVKKALDRVSSLVGFGWDQAASIYQAWQQGGGVV